MFAKLQYILQHNCQIELNKPVLMGVSGGPDSLCLLDLLWQMGYLVVVAHLNHGLRPSAESEAEFVRKEAESRQLQVICKESNVSEYARVWQISIEEAARIVRYQFLFEQAHRFGAQAVLVAHTADDQVETVLMHLLRGTGLGGLLGMPYRAVPNSWDAEIPLVRPLLGYWREEIQVYLEERGIQSIQDESNQDTAFLRNRLRHDLIPFLQEYNPRIKDAVLRMADILRGDHEIVVEAIDQAWEECCILTATDFVEINPGRFLKQPVGIQRGLIRKGIGVIFTGMEDIDYEVITRCLDFIQSATTGSINALADISIQKDGESIWLVSGHAKLPTNEFPQLQDRDGCWLEIPGKCELQDGWVFIAEYVSNNASTVRQALDNQDRLQAWVDGEKISNKVQLRGRNLGDRFQPMGMREGSSKISDIMIDHKIPHRVREMFPLVLTGDEIVWLPGSQPGHNFRITPETKIIIHLQVTRTGN